MNPTTITEILFTLEQHRSRVEVNPKPNDALIRISADICRTKIQEILVPEFLLAAASVDGLKQKVAAMSALQKELMKNHLEAALQNDANYSIAIDGANLAFAKVYRTLVSAQSATDFHNHFA